MFGARRLMISFIYIPNRKFKHSRTFLVLAKEYVDKGKEKCSNNMRHMTELDV